MSLTATPSISDSLKRSARASSHTRFFHAAQVRIGGAVIAMGHNEALAAGGWHAEARAIERATHRHRSIKGATVVSIRVTRTGKLANAKPCNNCLALCLDAGVKKVVYSTSQGTLETIRI